MSIWRFARYLPPIPAAAQVTLGEGGTPLVRSRRIGPAMGLQELYFKLDGQNPTGSYKDRFAVTAVSDMVAAGISRCVATSSGNTGAALAGYCAAAGIRCYIAIVETAPVDKLRQMMAYGARIFRVRQFGLNPAVTAGVFDGLRRFAATGNGAFQISAYRHSPVGMRGVQSIAYELAEDTSGNLDHVFCPAGSGGLVLAAVRGRGQRAQLYAGRARRSARGKQHDCRPVARGTRQGAVGRLHVAGQRLAGAQCDRR
jgi:threonine synthase